MKKIIACLLIPFFLIQFSAAREQAIILTEVLPDPEGRDSENEFIELFNQSQETINLASWTIKDMQEKTFVFKETKLQPQSFLVLNIKETKINLNNDIDKIKLFNEKNELIDSVSYKESKTGLSFSRNKDKWQWTEPTPGEPNLFLLNKEPAKAASSTIEKTAANGNIALFVFALLIAIFSGVLVFAYKKVDFS